MIYASVANFHIATDRSTYTIVLIVWYHLDICPFTLRNRWLLLFKPLEIGHPRPLWVLPVGRIVALYSSVFASKVDLLYDEQTTKMVGGLINVLIIRSLICR